MRHASLLLLVSTLGACDSLPAAPTGMSSTLSNMLRYGSTTEPPLARAAPAAASAYCPAVLVGEGQASLRRGSTQISIANVARECFDRAGGGTTIKVGVEGRVLLGPGGGSGRFDVPVSFVIRSGDRAVVSRVKRVPVSVPAGDSQGSFVSIEGDLVVPAGTGEFEIEVGLGGGASGSRRG